MLGVVERRGGALLKIRSEDFPFSIACSQKVVSLAKREESGGYRIGTKLTFRSWYSIDVAEREHRRTGFPSVPL